MPARITVRLYATAREAVGPSAVEVSVPPEGRSLDAVLAGMVRAHPKLSAVLPTARVARNGRYLRGRSALLRPGDEIAIHPPFSGG